MIGKGTCLLKAVCALYFSLMGSLAWALESHSVLQFSMDTEVGRDLSVLNLTVSQEWDSESEQLFLSDWSAAAGGAQAKTEDLSTGAFLTTRSRHWQASLGFGYDRHWRAGASVFSSNTTEPNFTQRGFEASIGSRAWQLGASAWAMGFEVQGSQSRIKQDLNIRILNTQTQREVELDQFESGISLKFYWLEKVFLSLNLAEFQYSRSKEDLQRAFTSRILNTVATDLISSLGSLPEKTESIQVIWSATPSLDLIASAARNTFIVDGSTNRRQKVVLENHYRDWSFGGGISRSETSFGPETLALLQLSWTVPETF
jgi:hypothetical protein